MKINRDKKIGWHYLNEDNVVLSIKDGGKGDSLGRTAIAAMIYDEDRADLIKGIKSFFLPDGYVVRYPGEPDSNFKQSQSRDHIIKALAILKLLGEDDFVKWYLSVRHRPKITKDFRLTPSQWLWIKGLYNPVWGGAFAAFATVENLATYVYNKLVRGIRPVVRHYKSLDSYNINREIPITEQQKRRKKFVVPDFAFFYSIWQALSVAGPVNRQIMKGVIGIHFERSNFVARLLTGRGLSPAEWVDAKEYKPTRAMRWSMRLDDLCDRWMKTWDDPTGSNTELDLLKALLDGNVVPKT